MLERPIQWIVVEQRFTYNKIVQSNGSLESFCSRCRECFLRDGNCIVDFNIVSLLQTMGCLSTFLLVVCGAATTLGSSWCSRKDANSVIAAWSQAFGAASNGNTNSAILGGTGFFIRYVNIMHSNNNNNNKNFTIIKQANVCMLCYSSKTFCISGAKLSRTHLRLQKDVFTVLLFSNFTPLLPLIVELP